GNNIPSFRGSWRIKEILRFFGNPFRQMKIWLGFEDFEFPGTKFLIDFLKNEKPDILNLHILHGFWLKDRGFFDLRLLPEITKITPTVLTLHDMWLMTGHCSQSLSCQRWESGCGKCPDITLPPQIRKDLSHFNWIIKKKIYQKSKFWCVAPSEWIANIAKRSILRYGMRDIRVIYNAVDLGTFKVVSYDEKMKIRGELGLPKDKFILISAAKSLKTNRWKGFDIFLKALDLLSERKDIFVVALGGAGWMGEKKVESIGGIKILYLPFEKDHRTVAKYFCASDFFILTSRAETLPLVLIEASACGAIPIASKVGGVPELIKDGINGFLVNSEDYAAFAQVIKRVLDDSALFKEVKTNAIENSKRFNIENQTKQYVEFFKEIIDNFKQMNKV
ncbi:MAG: glycosyltransferase, partial [Candidatus Caldarchaeum sp.]